jgi:hypothetical protein
LQNSDQCPTCNLTLTDLNNALKSDASLQRLIYKLMPNLLNNEIDRREKFIANETNLFYGSQIAINNNDNISIITGSSVLNVKLYNFQQSDFNHSDKKENMKHIITPNVSSQQVESNVKYIQCNAKTPLRILSKLIRNKYSIPNNYKVMI